MANEIFIEKTLQRKKLVSLFYVEGGIIIFEKNFSVNTKTAVQ